MSASMRPPVSENFMIGFTEQLIKDKKTDCGRWSRWDMLGTEADLRAGMAGQLVPENSSVLDAGAGMMLLRDYIPENCTYHPAGYCGPQPKHNCCRPQPAAIPWTEL